MGPDFETVFFFSQIVLVLFSWVAQKFCCSNTGDFSVITQVLFTLSALLVARPPHRNKKRTCECTNLTKIWVWYFCGLFSAESSVLNNSNFMTLRSVNEECEAQNNRCFRKTRWVWTSAKSSPQVQTEKFTPETEAQFTCLATFSLKMRPVFGLMTCVGDCTFSSKMLRVLSTF